MASSEQQHFESYRLQTRVKHAILEGYLPAYFHVIKRRHENLLFIDGFAGRGEYRSGDDVFPGSPLRALNIIASNQDFSERVQCIFIERSDEFFADLSRSVDSFYRDNRHIKEPIVVRGRFSEVIDELVQNLDNGTDLAPTFLFVDPCGVDGVSMVRIADILSRDFCEVFIFFNLDGIRRIAGLAKGGGVSPVLIDLYGSEEAAIEMVRQFERAGDAAAREAVIVGTYRDALRDASRADYILPLRVESEHRATTSHYLLHATKHPLGFKIMKDVMWKSGGDIECEGNTLALRQASSRGGARLFQPDRDELRRSILRELSAGPRRVSVFTDDWVERPDDMFSQAVYRRELLALERAGSLVVLQKDGRTPYPPDKRRKQRGEPTLPGRLWVRLPG